MERAAEQTGSPSGCRVLVIDDNELVLLGVRELLAREPWVARCVGVRSCAEALRAAARVEPRLALIELFVGEDYGVEICRRLRAAIPALQVLFISDAGQISPAAARSVGASGFVLKCTPAADIVAALHRVHLGRLAFQRTIAVQPRSRLTVREREIVSCIAQGATNREIGEQLFLSPHTVKQHTSRVYRKLGARNRAEAVRMAQRVGVIG